MTVMEKCLNYIMKLFSIVLLGNKQNLEVENISKIIIVGDYGIGDSVFFFPVLSNIFAMNPKIDVTIMTHNKSINTIFKNNFPKINTEEYQPVEFGLMKTIKFYSAFRKRKYNLLVCNFLGLRKKYMWLILFSKIPHRIGHVFLTNPGWQKYNFIFNYKIQVKDEHYINSNLALLKPLNQKAPDRKINFNVAVKSEHKTTNFLQNKGINEFIVMQAHSSVGPIKNWPMERYSKLIAHILKNYAYTIILLGSDAEKEYLEQLIIQKDRVYNAAGLLSIDESAALVKKASLYIGNDGGLGKISIALNIPTITIWGSSDYTRAKAWDINGYDLYNKVSCAPCAFRVGYPHNAACTNNDPLMCFKSINVAQVIEVVNSVLTR